MKFLFQLKTASDCGITIPTTLCSKDPEEIRSFFLQHEFTGIIYKPLNSEGKPKKITQQDFFAHQSLQRLPGIFQSEREKQYELRITCCGHYVVAAKLNSEPSQQRVITPHALSDELVIKIRTFMQELRVSSGTCDFMVTPDNDYVFRFFACSLVKSLIY